MSGRLLKADIPLHHEAKGASQMREFNMTIGIAIGLSLLFTGLGLWLAVEAIYGLARRDGQLPTQPSQPRHRLGAEMPEAGQPA